MKKQIRFLAIIVIILASLSSCQKSVKDQLVGTWAYSKTMSTNDGEITMNGVETKSKDGTYSEETNATLTSETEINGYKVRMKIGMTMKDAGDWTLNEKEIASSPTSAGVKVTSLGYYDIESGELLVELTGQELVQASNIIVGEMKSSLMEASTARIIMLQEDKYVTEEESEDDGTKTTITYRRMK